MMDVVLVKDILFINYTQLCIFMLFTLLANKVHLHRSYLMFLAGFTLGLPE